MWVSGIEFKAMNKDLVFQKIITGIVKSEDFKLHFCKW